MRGFRKIINKNNNASPHKSVIRYYYRIETGAKIGGCFSFVFCFYTFAKPQRRTATTMTMIISVIKMDENYMVVFLVGFAPTDARVNGFVIVAGDEVEIIYVHVRPTG